MSPKIRLLMLSAAAFTFARAQSQPAPSVSQVLMWSTLTPVNLQTQSLSGVAFTPSVAGQSISNAIQLPQRALLSIYTESAKATDSATLNIGTINEVTNYSVANPSALSSVLSANIAVALSEIPLAAPASGFIRKTDPATGLEYPERSIFLGPIFTQRAETIGKGKFYVGVTHQNYHFTSLNGLSLNGLSVLYLGGDKSAITINGSAAKTVPATFNLGLDVRLSQDIAFVTYGATSRFDVAFGFPIVHAAVASTAYNGIIYSGSGLFTSGSQCWCINTFTPGTVDLAKPFIGQSSLSKSGFGDMILRLKGTVLERRQAVLAVGTDLRFPTGDEKNYLGTGTPSVKPFAALSLFSKPLAGGIVIAPHAELAWQISGKSTLAGTLQATSQPVSITGFSAAVPLPVAPLLISSKDYLPDIFSWGVGSEIAFGKNNTVSIDFLGNQVGWIHGAPTVQNTVNPAVSGSVPAGAQQAMASGLTSLGRSSFGQYNGSFGYKVRLPGNLIATFDAVVRLNDAGLTARFSPLFGLGYSFGR